MFFEEGCTDFYLSMTDPMLVHTQPNGGSVVHVGGYWGDNPLDWRINTLDPLLLATIVEILSITDTCTNKT